MAEGKEIVVELPRGTQPMQEEPEGTTITFTHLDETTWQGKRILHMVRVISRPGKKQETATLIFGFIAGERRIGIESVQTARVILPTNAEQGLIERDLKMLYRRPVVFYR